MTTSEMLELLKQRTKISDAAKLLRELRVAYRWAVNEIFKSADGPQLLMTVGEELPTLAATTRDYDLESNLVGGNMLGLQTLWVKLPNAVDFTRILPRDVTSEDFAVMDGGAESNPKIATGFPIFYAMLNFGQVRFAPALPAASVLRADYAMLGAAPDPTTNPTQEDGTDVPSLFHDAIVYQAAVLLCITLDDDRAAAWGTLAVTTLSSAIYAAGKGVRTQRPVTVAPFRRGSRRREI